MIRILDSAYKHGLEKPAILSAFSNPIYSNHAQSNPLKILLLGISEDMHLIEIAYTINDDGTTVIFHAMKAPTALINQSKRHHRKKK